MFLRCRLLGLTRGGNIQQLSSKRQQHTTAAINAGINTSNTSDEDDAKLVINIVKLSGSHPITNKHILERIRSGPPMLADQMLRQIILQRAVVPMASQQLSSHVLINLLSRSETAHHHKAIQTAIDGKASELACSQFGSAFIRTALATLQPPERDLIITDLLRDDDQIAMCANDRYGASTMHHLLHEHASICRPRIASVLMNRLAGYEFTLFTPHFFSELMKQADEPQLRSLIGKLLSSSDLLTRAIGFEIPHASMHAVLLRVLELSTQNERDRICELLQGHLTKVTNTFNGASFVLSLLKIVDRNARDVMVSELLSSSKHVAGFTMDEARRSLLIYLYAHGTEREQSFIREAVTGNLVIVFQSDYGRVFLQRMIEAVDVSATQKQQQQQQESAEEQEQHIQRQRDAIVPVVLSSLRNKQFTLNENEIGFLLYLLDTERTSANERGMVFDVLKGKMQAIANTEYGAHSLLGTVLHTLDPISREKLFVGELLRTADDVIACGMTKYGSTFISDLLEHGNFSERSEIVSAIIIPENTSKLATCKAGIKLLKHSLGVMDPKDAQRLIDNLTSSRETILKLAMDMYGTNILHFLIQNTSTANINRIYEGCQGKFVEVGLTDKGFMLINAFADTLGPSERTELVDELLAVPQQVVEWSMHRRASLAIQNLIKNNAGDFINTKIGDYSIMHDYKILKSKNANELSSRKICENSEEKCAENRTMDSKEKDRARVVELITGHVVEIAQSPPGSNLLVLLSALLKKESKYRNMLMSELVVNPRDVVECAGHISGTHVFKAMLKHGTIKDRVSLVAALKGRVMGLATSSTLGSELVKYLLNELSVDEPGWRMVVDELLASPESILELALKHDTHDILKSVIQKSSAADHELLVGVVINHRDKLANTKLGKPFLRFLLDNVQVGSPARERLVADLQLPYSTAANTDDMNTVTSPQYLYSFYSNQKLF